MPVFEIADKLVVHCPFCAEEFSTGNRGPDSYGQLRFSLGMHMALCTGFGAWPPAKYPTYEDLQAKGKPLRTPGDLEHPTP